jgi:hypothetical protein
MRRGSRISRPVTIRIRIGEAVETAGLTVDDRDDVILEVRRRIEAMLGST